MMNPDEHKRYPNPHDRHYEKAWRNCRRGYLLCMESPAAMATVVKHIGKFTARGPHIYGKWLEILEGEHPDHATYLLDERYDNYFDMPHRQNI